MAARMATRFGAQGYLKTAARPCSGARSYATHPPPSHGGRNRAIIAGLVIVSFPALAYSLSRNTAAASTPQHTEGKIARPRLDPAADAVRNAERTADGPRHVHPEHEDPEAFKPGFGRLHQRKRVDSPPDGRNHADLNAKNKQI